ncbi:hypothetical protein [Glycomyces sp. NPDC021274]|uniref:hypothetical protein n=1 Tax=Glycomyces sp. NPDC021274 TaxID=3155120 RepID=UPI0033C5E0FE
MTWRVLVRMLLLPVMVAWWVVYTVFWAAWGRDSSRDGYSAGGIFWPYAHPKVIVFGADSGAMAVRFLSAMRLEPDAGVWVLTDRRFARVALSPQIGERDRGREVRRHYGVEASLEQCISMPPEPMVCRTELEIAASQFRCETATRRLSPTFRSPRSQIYQRITFADGSGFDFHKGDGAGPR